MGSPFKVRFAVRMPGKSHEGPLPPLTEAQGKLAGELRAHVEHLAIDIGERNVSVPERLHECEWFLASELGSMELTMRCQTFTAARMKCANLDADVPGSAHPEEIVVVGAHYDSFLG